MVVTASAGSSAPPRRHWSSGRRCPAAVVLVTPFGPTNPDLPTAEVNGLYQILFGHRPDPTGLTNSVTYLNNGGSLQSLSIILMDTTDYEKRVVAQDYSPSPAGPARVVGGRRLGEPDAGRTTPEQVAYLMLTSDGFNATHPTDASFVQALYNDVLGRQASDSEVAGWTALIASGTTRAGRRTTSSTASRR